MAIGNGPKKEKEILSGSSIGNHQIKNRKITITGLNRFHPDFYFRDRINEKSALVS